MTLWHLLFGAQIAVVGVLVAGAVWAYRRFTRRSRNEHHDES
jgi:hypothetical protein